MHHLIHREQLKSAMLPIAILGGALFYKWMHYVYFLSPYLVFAMLFITYCKLNLRDFRPNRGHILLLVVQALLTAVVYFPLREMFPTVAQGLFMCVFMPTATAAPVITSMLGGSLSYVASFSLLDNAAVAVLGPLILAGVGSHPEITFVQSSLLIMSKVAPLLILPIVAALLIRKIWPRAHSVIVGHQQLSFYIWAFSLFIIVGNCVSFTIAHWNPQAMDSILAMVGGALAICLVQFLVGRMVGNYMARRKIRNDDKESESTEIYRECRVSAAQGLMQKNTVLGVWISLAYLHPLASVAPAAYILWQNLLNSAQIWRHKEQRENR